MGRHTQYIVSLSQEEKNKLQAMSKDNKLSARVSKRVLILLALDDKKNSNLNEKLNSICGLSRGCGGGADRILDQISFRRFICIHTKTVSAL